MEILKDLADRVHQTLHSDASPEKLPWHIQLHPLKEWDQGLFDGELVRLGLQSVPLLDSSDDKNRQATRFQIEEGTYEGTQAALTEMYSRIECS